MSTSTRVVDNSHFQRSFQKLLEFQRNRKLCDIKLKVRGQEIFAHKSVLASCSSYFEIMFDASFCESNQNSVDLKHETTFEIMSIIVEYLYSGVLSFPPDDVCLLIKNMNYFGVECETIFKKVIDHKNCIPLYVIADETLRVDLKEIAITYILEHFKEIIVNDAFNAVSKNQLVDVLKRVDNLKADIIYEVAISWLKQDENRRVELMEEVLSYVPVDDLSHTLICNKIMKDKFLRDNIGGCRWLLSSILDNPARFSVNKKPVLFYIMSQYNSRYVYEFNQSDKSLVISQNRPQMADCSFTMYNNIIYVVAGNRGRRSSDVGLRYDTNQRVWTEFNCKVGRICCGTCSRHNKLLLIGGTVDKKYQSACSYYDYYTGRIVNLPNMIVRRSRPGVSVYNSSIYVFGGIDAKDYRNMIERFDPREGRWYKAGLLDYRTNCSSAVLGDSIYCLKTGSKNIVRYDPRIMQHTPVNLSNAVIGGSQSSQSSQSYSYCLGIRDEQLYRLDNVGLLRYWPEGDSWKNILSHNFDDDPIFVV